MAPEVTPAGYLCPSCGYAAGELPADVCPECALAVNEEAIAAWQERLRLESSGSALLRRQLAAAAALCIAYSLGAGALAWDLDEVRTLLAALWLLVGGSLSLGFVSAALTPVGSRRLASIIWLQHLWLLHLPWLVVGPVAALALGATWVESLLGFRGGLLIGLFVLSAPAWIILIFVAPVTWAKRTGEAADRAMLRSPSRPVMAWCSLAVVAASAVLGGVAAAKAALFALDAW